jgi:hypothetical protein
VRNADVVLVLDHGDIVERGTFDELLARKGFFTRSICRSSGARCRPTRCLPVATVTCEALRFTPKAGERYPSWTSEPPGTCSAVSLSSPTQQDPPCAPNDPSDDSPNGQRRRRARADPHAGAPSARWIPQQLAGREGRPWPSTGKLQLRSCYSSNWVPSCAGQPEAAQ